MESPPPFEKQSPGAPDARCRAVLSDAAAADDDDDGNCQGPSARPPAASDVDGADLAATLVFELAETTTTTGERRPPGALLDASRHQPVEPSPHLQPPT
ncbi:hypothetical protein LY76DRAFT_650019 [Colletotrichum caudatum]|nr:hypothetical protein LY76DRAFT_650019 [Colletotrichum caudatum]